MSTSKHDNPAIRQGVAATDSDNGDTQVNVEINSDDLQQPLPTSEMNRIVAREMYNDFIAKLSCNQLLEPPNPLNARYYYGIIFLLTNMFAWIVRDYGHKFLSELDRLKDCQGGHDCLGTEGALRVSMGCFIFFFIMFFTTVGSRHVHEARDSWHSKWWPVKGIMWIILVVVPFFIPSAFIQFYGEIARFGAGIFLIIQLISIINFITWWNRFWHSEKTVAKCRPLMIATTTVTYLTSFVGIILLYIWYAPDVSCHLNTFFITWTLILILAITAVSYHPNVNAGFVTSGLMSLYIVFLCWSALRSEPETEKCNTRPQATGRGDGSTVVGFIIAMAATVMATFSAGIDSKSFRFKNAVVEKVDNEIPYGYGFFHFVFAMGAMYFGMLFIGWNLHQTMLKWSIDVGWISTWLKIVNEWLAAALYVWTLIAPLVWKKDCQEQRIADSKEQVAGSREQAVAAKEEETADV